MIRPEGSLGSLVLSLLILSVLAVPASEAQRHPGYNYEESGVLPYTLIDPLVLSNGQPVRDPAMWTAQRRPEILHLFEEHLYGRTPANAHVSLKYKIVEVDRHALGGKAIRKQVAIYFSAKGEAGRGPGPGPGPKMSLLLYLPSAAKRPVPVVLGLNFFGNHTVIADPGIALPAVWKKRAAPAANGASAPPAEYFLEKADEKSRGMQTQQWQVEAILAHGYGFATVYCGDIEPDFEGGMKYGVRPLFFRNGQTAPADDEWGAFGAWAWGLSRALDYLEKEKQVDRKRIAVTGHSRLGKTADWAAAQDTRFALVLSTESGKGGQSLLRRSLGEDTRHLINPYGYWFCGNFRQWNGRDREMPVDGNLLLALLAPRPVYVASAEEDLWSDPQGEFISAVDVSRVYRFLGKRGLDAGKRPAVNEPIMRDVAYHIRTGKHDVTAFDWEQYLKFMDMHFGKR